MKVKAEGGKIPLYPEASTLASYNDRLSGGEEKLVRGKW